jgi:hypothetical protein
VNNLELLHGRRLVEWYSGESAKELSATEIDQQLEQIRQLYIDVESTGRVKELNPTKADAYQINLRLGRVVRMLFKNEAARVIAQDERVNPASISDAVRYALHRLQSFEEGNK